ncbi:Cacna1h [Symbiodinium natans]|uniref:Cacna1h protein n=1 Tax=Symbiodinium natans TaxID=878477 RepID=A0A812RA39_9DINO|nr:Cacna1h [Symbiodinium natans]
MITDLAFLILEDDVGNVASVKAVRLMRVFRFVMAFRTLITSILYTLKSLFWALMLLIVIVYVFGVLFTQAVNDFLLEHDAAISTVLTARELELANKYFGSLANSMLSLYMSIAGGVSWEDVISPLLAVSEIWGFLFLFYISFTLFAVLNVVTGVFCQSAIESAQNDHTAVVHSILKNKKAHVDKIKALFSKLGDDKTGAITFAMFEEKINSPAVQAYFEVLGLDVWDDAGLMSRVSG